MDSLRLPGWARYTVAAAVLAAFAIAGFVLAARAPPSRTTSPEHGALPPAPRMTPAVPVGPVEAEMQNVLFHVDDRVVLRIDRLRGFLRPTSKSAPPWFDDPESFVLV